jgi:hypothetical protein
MEPDEVWLPVVEYESLYSVSDLGRVRSVPRRVRNGSGMRTVPSKLIAMHAISPYGHLGVTLWRENVAQRVPVHRLVLTTFIGPRPPAMQGCHGPGGAGDNQLCNLRWDTHVENMLDMVRHGTHGMARRTHCKFDHPLTAPNLVPSLVKLGKRSCLACNRASTYVHMALSRHGQVLDLRVEADRYYRKVVIEQSGRGTP